MTAFLQMGHDSINLVGETDLDSFKGVILSPINEVKDDLLQCVERIQRLGRHLIFFDPQLYFPKSQRGNLSGYPYFPSDLDTADLTSDTWWSDRVKSLAAYATGLKIDFVASPAVHPNTWADEYYSRCANMCQELCSELSSGDIKVFSTVMIGFNQIEDKDEALKIASIVSESDSDGYYLVVSTDIEPRRELASEKGLLGVMKLISALEGTGKPVLVSNCSSEMILYKYAGASHCASGKFFNLRRYTQSRYDDDESTGGGQAAYWFEHSLLASLRLADILRLKESNLSNLIGTSFSNNYWSQRLEENFTAVKPRKGIREGWRQYLSWFSKAETFLSENNPITEVPVWLKQAENNWLALEEAGILFDEPRNNGSWIRPWRQATNAFSKPN